MDFDAEIEIAKIIAHSLCLYTSLSIDNHWRYCDAKEKKKCRKTAKKIVDRLRKSLDPDMPPQELRLHMGELTASEIPVARAAIRWANSAIRLGERGARNCTAAQNNEARRTEISKISPAIRKQCHKIAMERYGNITGQTNIRAMKKAVNAVLAELNIRVDAQVTSVRLSIEDTMGRR